VFDQSAATVGDLKTAGSELDKPQASVLASADAVTTAQADLSKAQQDLADAQRSLAVARASAASSSAPTTTSSTTTTTTLVPSATIDRVKKAESDFDAATHAVTDQTPLSQATVQLNSAAVTLEMAWLQVFNAAGCLTDQQQKQAVTQVHDYTVALQTALHSLGYYSGEIDGLYGAATAQAVQKLQTASGLPATGWVDRATAAALDAALLSAGGQAATQAHAYTAAVQSTLKLAGYWTGAVDGNWTPELTTALMNFQTALGVPATGVVDAATLAALEQTISNAQSGATSTTATTSTKTPSTASTESSAASSSSAN
jgi:peptidoglycan hydrolase-like protein with peptidoglycan-binding domain